MVLFEKAGGVSLGNILESVSAEGKRVKLDRAISVAIGDNVEELIDSLRLAGLPE